MLLPWTTGCRDIDRSLSGESAVPEGAPYILTILTQENCPVPEGLDPRNVIIQSYKVKLVGGTTTGVPANYFYASLLTEDGHRYLAEFEGCAPVLSGPPLDSGQTAVGYLNFPLPPSKSAKTLEFAPRLLRDEESAITRLQLGSPSANDPDEEQ
jgi:hypothetical protein